MILDTQWLLISGSLESRQYMVSCLMLLVVRQSCLTKVVTCLIMKNKIESYNIIKESYKKVLVEELII